MKTLTKDEIIKLPEDILGVFRTAYNSPILTTSARQRVLRVLKRYDFISNGKTGRHSPKDLNLDSFSDSHANPEE